MGVRERSFAENLLFIVFLVEKRGEENIVCLYRFHLNAAFRLQTFGIDEQALSPNILVIIIQNSIYPPISFSISKEGQKNSVPVFAVLKSRIRS